MEHKNLHSALLAAQKEIKHAVKDATNPHFKNQYATLESVIDAVKDIANKHGIFIAQPMGKDEHGQYIETKLMTPHGDLTSKCYLLVDKLNMQGLGSSISYARRYSLAAIFSLAQVDDDASMATESFNNWNKPKTQTKGNEL
jgi:hypothetical protein